MIVRKVVRKNPLQVGFVEHDEMFEALSANGTDESLDVRRLPWRAVSGHHLLDTRVLDSLSEELAVDRVTISK